MSYYHKLHFRATTQKTPEVTANGISLRGIRFQIKTQHRLLDLFTTAPLKSWQIITLKKNQRL